MNKLITLFLCFLMVVAVPSRYQVAAQLPKGKVNVVTQEPSSKISLEIKGPQKSKAGDLVILSVEDSNAASFKWLVLPSTDNFLVIDEGRRAVFSSGEAGTFIFTCAAALGDEVEVKHFQLTVTGTAQPVNSLLSKIATWCDLVTSDTKRDDALKLAQSFSSVAALIESDSITGVEDIVKITYKSNQDALGPKREQWAPWAEALSNELFALSQQGKLTSVEDHVVVWRQISDGLKEYAEGME